MKIEGNKNPLINSIYTVRIIIEGKSTASYGDFSTTVFLYDKEGNTEIAAIPAFFLTGSNPFQINLKYFSGEGKIKSGNSYVLKAQHANIIAEFEFVPLTGEELEKLPSEEDKTVTEEASPAQAKPQAEAIPRTGQSLEVVAIEPTRIPDRYLVVFEICSGNTKLTVPEVVASSDSESFTREVGSVLGAGSCLLYDVSVTAKNPNTIKVEFGNVVQDDTTIEELRKEISELKEQLKKKDEVLIEQLKVIQNLASMIKKTVFDSFMNIFNLL